MMNLLQCHFARMRQDKEKRVFLWYEFCVTTILIVCFGFLLYQGKGYIYLDIAADTYCSYWPQFSLVHDILWGAEGLWSYRIGLGDGVIGYLSIEPFSVLISMFKPEDMDVGITLVVILKYYIISYLAYYYLRELDFQPKVACIGGLCYTFCGFFTGWGQHYFFGSMFVYFTLCLYAFERWLHKKGWLLLSLSVCLLFLCSIYFCYIAFIFCKRQNNERIEGPQQL